MQVGLFVDFGFYTAEVTVFEKRWSKKGNLIDPLVYTPSPFGSVATQQNGRLTITELNDLECEGKEGSIGAETIQCWQTESNPPIIRTYKNVRNLETSGGRRLQDDFMASLESANTQPRSLLANPSVTYNCIQSNLNVSQQCTKLIVVPCPVLTPVVCCC